MAHTRSAPVAASTLDCFGRIFDALGFGTLVIGPDLQILHFNRLAKQHFGAGLHIKAGGLAASDPASDKVLQNILREHRDGASEARSALGLGRIDRRPLILRIVDIAGDMRPVFEGAALVAVLVDPETCPEPSPVLLQQLFGLTRKEARVATRLMCGLTVQEIAKEAGVSVGTIRAQIKAVFAKTGTKRQAELVGLMTRLAVISKDVERTLSTGTKPA
ncbi:helix-turn-helix transcriptional regulator [Microvirga lenta]|uniref:helix-turn-helix transcriptional regulator n=1 Tax=Microvirga lenta TaxID=2881337 RepID=UPI001CFFB70A|nr:helix-turn-helix transcriptional regulator [Microvirga lenta]MCB5175403.1 helix-turn-helix transcriptional regulator [Microvirga lenta]